jgi:hypothetical protein
MKKNCHVPMCFVHITNNTLGGYLCVIFTMFNSLHPMHTKDFFLILKNKIYSSFVRNVGWQSSIRSLGQFLLQVAEDIMEKKKRKKDSGYVLVTF